jgi:hypothetical protein
VADEQVAQAAAAQQTSQQSSSSATQSTSQAAAAQAAASSPTQTTTAASQSSSATTLPTRPDWAPEAHWDAEKGTFKDTFGAHFNELTAWKAADDSRRAALPQAPDGYKPELPKDFKAPEGMKFEFKTDDPALKSFAAIAHKAGLTQEQYSEALSAYAADRLATQQNIDNAKAAEVTKLGVNGPARKTAVDTWLTATLGEDLGKHMSQFTFTAKQVEGFERLIAKTTSQGAATFSQAHRDAPNAPGRVSEEQYNAMSQAEKWAYAKSHDQSQFRTNGTRQ